jgi:thiol-disulfide isomerase/thioredoxin
MINIYGFNNSKKTFIEGNYTGQDKYKNFRFKYLNPDKEHYLSILITNIAFDGRTDVGIMKDSIRTIIEKNRKSIALMKGLYMISGGEGTDHYGASYFDTVYNLFSTDIKNSFYGKLVANRIENRMSVLTKIPIIELKRADTGNIEPVIKDDGRYKLIIFSAAWCAPCHEIIPVYKEIYKDLGDKLDMLYISIDDEKDATKWNDLIKKYKIPWRSYLSDNESQVNEIYAIWAIPRAYLVHPDLSAESIDVRDEKTKQRLYQLISNM